MTVELGGPVPCIWCQSLSYMDDTGAKRLARMREHEVVHLRNQLLATVPLRERIAELEETVDRLNKRLARKAS